MPKIEPLPVAALHNREGWLTEVSRGMEYLFKGFSLSKYRVTCGWPCVGALSKARRVGECHGAKSSKDGVFELFISPVLDDPLEVAGTVCHELAHVAAGIDARHGSGFVKVCRHVGLTKGKPMSASPGPYLEERLGKLLLPLGPYPHAALLPTSKPKKPSKMVSLECSCGCKFSIAQKWLDQSGYPTCGCGGEMAIRDKEDK